jgi:hypothetical protein
MRFHTRTNNSIVTRLDLPESRSSSIQLIKVPSADVLRRVVVLDVVVGNLVMRDMHASESWGELFIAVLDDRTSLAGNASRSG